MEGMEELGIQDDDDDKLSIDMSGLSLADSSPTPRERTGKKKKDRQVPRQIDEDSDHPKDGEPSGHKGKISQEKIITMNHIEDNRPSLSVLAEPKDLRFPKRGRVISSSRKDKNSRALSSIIIGSNDEPRETLSHSSSTPDKQVPVSDELESLKPTHPTPQSSDKRSKSASQHPDTTLQGPGTSVFGEISHNSPGKSKEASGTFLVPPHKSKRRAPSGKSTSTPNDHKIRHGPTGLHEAPEAPSRSIEPMNLGDEEPTDDAAIVKPITPPKAGRQSSSSAHPQMTQNTRSDVTPAFPKLKDFYNSKKCQNGLKLEILEAIQGKKESKRVKIRAILNLLTSMWNEWSESAKESSKRASSEDDGYIYIFRSRPDSFPGRNYVKIGMTKQMPEKRKKEWEGKCKFEFIHIEDGNDKRFFHYGKAEKIIHAELYNERRKFKCNKCHRCHDLELGEDTTRRTATEHGEWFEISEEKALEVVNKWRNWIILKKPYRYDGTLRAIWTWKCRVVSICMQGTEADWIAWRGFNRFETLQYFSYHFKEVLRRALPPAFEFLMTPGAIFGPAIVWYFWAFGVNLGSCLAFLAALLVLAYALVESC
jgi:hypothetical protein